MPFRVLVGLPSFNEADTIAKVALDIDAALNTLPFPTEALLANADNASADGTSDAFISAATKHDKVVVTTPHQAGKGTNWQALLSLAVEQGVDAVLFVDTDLAEVPESWVHTLVGSVREGTDFCFPLRPPTWNGGDLTYQLAYPLLAGVFGADLREPLCGDIALSGRAARDVLAQEWAPDELRFGVDFLIASVAVCRSWRTVRLTGRRRNKLRSFTTEAGGEYRMGAKFAEVSSAIGHRIAMRLRQPPPVEVQVSAAETPVDAGLVVPSNDADIAELARSTTRRLRADARGEALSVFPPMLADRLGGHIESDAVTRGLGWPNWRDCLFAWIASYSDPEREVIPVELLETLFLNRVVGHHTEIAGTTGWYLTVQDQAQDVFTHRHTLWDKNVRSFPALHAAAARGAR